MPPEQAEVAADMLAGLTAGRLWRAGLRGAARPASGRAAPPASVPRPAGSGELPQGHCTAQGQAPRRAWPGVTPGPGPALPPMRCHSPPPAVPAASRAPSRIRLAGHETSTARAAAMSPSRTAATPTTPTTATGTTAITTSSEPATRPRQASRLRALHGLPPAADRRQRDGARGLAVRFPCPAAKPRYAAARSGERSKRRGRRGLQDVSGASAALRPPQA